MVLVRTVVDILERADNQLPLEFSAAAIDKTLPDCKRKPLYPLRRGASSEHLIEAQMQHARR